MDLSILVIDDEDGIRRSLTRILREDGYSVSVASRGEEALELILNNPTKYDIVICDLLMPGIGGIATIEEINRLNSEITKIILTGYGTLESSIKAIEAGVDGFITKPFENKELTWKVRECYLKRKTKQFISDDIYKELLKEPNHLLPRLSFITILFSDIRGFTQLSSQVPPDELASLLNNDYFHPMCDIIIKHKGMIDKYIGDSIMALFGAPVANESHAENAVNCAIEMVKRIKDNNGRFGMGIGISTGRVITGIFGSVSKKEYTALGMPVNLAARLQKLAGPGDIIISDITKSRLNGLTPFQRAGTITFTTLSGPTTYFKWICDG
ncbi:MAG TPA: adenylate/guanylate cyclase domain-containing protein [Syntrophorhabdus sp.]|nr:adenylate/guanylate cyclase domain-containing protein [Syntrophorhabdus sp.]HOH27311.1 adenylate/guanylate cyclase domain-containing protein [Syntrophorhabdus sp.]HPB38938.1 adenylate/guanylate cyclase domain-containing protein [Syntrophorhabdus sp.]HQP55815.1 adenylate/guanylate cyclase domain-containing protein [Syntrophorhabdus sp.]